MSRRAGERFSSRTSSPKGTVRSASSSTRVSRLLGLWRKRTACNWTSRKVPECREGTIPNIGNNCKQKIQPNQRLLKFLVLEIIQTFMTPLTPHLGKTRLDLGKQPMKLGKKATDPGNSRHLGHPALKNRANPGNLPVGLIRDQLDPRSTKGENASAAKYGPPALSRNKWKKNRQPGSNYVAPACLIPADESAASYGPA